jgi:ribokinase
MPIPSIVVVGSLNMDFVVSVKRLPRPGETVLGSDFIMVPGGKGANQACAAGKLASSSAVVRMIGRVGKDLFADHLKASLAAAGVDVSGVHAAKSQPTGCALISVDEDGQNSIVVASGANFELAAADVEAMRKSFHGASIALFQLENPLPTIAAALRLAREEGVTTILDPAPAQVLAADILGNVDILTPNENEALKLLGRPEVAFGDGFSMRHGIQLSDAPDIAASLLALGPRTVILKLGEEGCYVVQPDWEEHVEGFVVDAVDTTAAGDTFNAALAVALAQGQSLSQAAVFANAAAAISVTRPGAQPSAPTRAEVDAFLSQRKGTF